MICEVALCRSSQPETLARLLDEVPGTADSIFVHDLVLQLMHAKLDTDESQADQIARSLYFMATAEGLKDDNLYGIAWWAWDALDLADMGSISETRLDVVTQMRAALKEAAERANVRGHTWQFPPL